MSALPIQHHAEPQLGLIGIPAAEPPAAPRMVIHGQLQRHAEVRTGVDGSVHLVLQIVQPPKGLPFITTWRARDPQTGTDLRHYGPRMRAGASVTVTGSSLVLGLCDDGHDALLLQRCDAVQVLDVASFAHPSDPSE